uniref:ethylmalonyl-CoA decarboxylase-like n=2 Tax=Myxine glutinosa TaxID=7769 RepID=UPI00358E3EA8
MLAFGAFRSWIVRRPPNFSLCLRCLSLPAEPDADDAALEEQLLGFPGGSVDLKLHDESEGENSGLAVITLNNPRHRNAFSGVMMVEMRRAVEKLEVWQDGKGLILHGSGNAFCSGSDLNAVRAMSTTQDGMMMSLYMQNTLARLQRLPILSVALVQGKALGGGAELTTACDFRLMSPYGEICFVHKHMGLVPGWGGVTHLSRILGPCTTLRIIAGATRLNPDEALALGLADAILESSEETLAFAEAMRWLGHLTRGPAEVTRAIKKAVIMASEHKMEDSLANERTIFGTLWGGPANVAALQKRIKHK